MKEFVSDEDTPQYAILSHTWNEEEVTYQQWEVGQSPDLAKLKGYAKVQEFKKQASKDGSAWIWADT